VQVDISISDDSGPRAARFLAQQVCVNMCACVCLQVTFLHLFAAAAVGRDLFIHQYALDILTEEEVHDILTEEEVHDILTEEEVHDILTEEEVHALRKRWSS